VSTATGDLAPKEVAPRLVADVIARHGRLDILVNNAGIIRRAPAAEHGDTDWDDVIAMNLSSVFRMCREAGRHMLERKRGKIVNIASLLAFQAASRCRVLGGQGGVAQLTKALANEWASRGINVNAIAPGYMVTENTRRLREDPSGCGNSPSASRPAGGASRGSRRRRRVSRLVGIRLRQRSRARR